MLSHVSRSVTGPKSRKRIPNAGTIAIDLVSKTLYQTGNLMFRNPSITNWPEYVPVIVELYPAANKPIAQIYFAAFPKVEANASDASNKSRLHSSRLLWLQGCDLL